MEETHKRHIAILGSTGSIGTQTLEVISSYPDFFELEVLTAGCNADLLIEQAIKYKPNAVVIADESQYIKVRDVLFDKGIKVYTGNDAIEQIVTQDNIDYVVTAMVGFAGLKPTISAIKAKKQIALANKETLVVAGSLITDLAKKNIVNIYPVDSEHSAIFQCLAGEFNNPIEKIILTASGGPFRGKTSAFLQQVRKEQALKHPNWQMGCKITIDSATLMNKGLEVIEAKWLFNLKPNQIEVVVHPQSIIHSMVQFKDGSIKAQLGLPDMKLPIQYALTYPQRLETNFPRLDLETFSSFTFEKPNTEVFKCLNLAYYALEKGGNMPCIMNAANEIAVELFLKDKITFLQIAELVERCMNKIDFVNNPSIDDLMHTNSETRKLAYNK